MVPIWVKDAVFYQIFPDRFAVSREVPKVSNLEPWLSPPTIYGFKGGDLIGVLENLDYLQDLGINAIYLTPIFSSTANHRYHTHNYFEVDPILGGNKAFRKLLDAAHRRSIRVILDGVFNHASRGFYQFNHTLENGSHSPYIDWFHFNQEWINSGRSLEAYHSQAKDGQASCDAYGYHAWWDIPSLPKFNTQNLAVRDFIYRVAKHWLEFGIDGWRLDVPEEINDDHFWREFRQKVKSVNSDAYLVGEIWNDASHWINHGDIFDATMNYRYAKVTISYLFRDSLKSQVFAHTGFSEISPLSDSTYAQKLQAILRDYPQSIWHAQMTMLTSHDTPRLATIAGGQIDRMKLAYLLFYTFPGTPCLYYGEEIGMEGEKDPGCRGSFHWEAYSWNYALRNFIKTCIQLRRKYRALRRGDYAVIKADSGVFSFKREYQDEVIIGCVNSNEQPITCDIFFKIDGKNPIQKFRDILQRDTCPYADGQLKNVNMKPLEGKIFIGETSLVL